MKPSKQRLINRLSVFALAAICASLLYELSVPDGLPWAGLREITSSDLSSSRLLAALATGLVGGLFTHFFGRRVGVSAALVFMTMPPVWNRVVFGVTKPFVAVIAACCFVELIWMLSRKAREYWEKGKTKASTRAFLSMLKTVTLALSCLVVVGFLACHDYRAGEAASFFARQILDEVGDRTLVLDGGIDAQLIQEAERRSLGSSRQFIPHLVDAAGQAQFVAHVHQTWPTSTNLWIAAQVGPSIFVRAAMDVMPEKMYVQTGLSTTREQWAARWKAFQPYLKSSDPFVPVARRLFAHEGVIVGARLQCAGDEDAAWQIYCQVMDEVDAENMLALHLMDSLIERGHSTSEARKALVAKGLASEKRLNDELQKQQATSERAVREKSTLKEVVLQNNEMLESLDRQEYGRAKELARSLLSRPGLHSFRPANAVMGLMMSREGDYVASEAFFSAAIANETNAPAVVCNDYADALFHLGKLDRAEALAREAIAHDPATNAIYRLTLAQILTAKDPASKEAAELMRTVKSLVPETAWTQIRTDFPNLP